MEGVGGKSVHVLSTDLLALSSRLTRVRVTAKMQMNAPPTWSHSLGLPR